MKLIIQSSESVVEMDIDNPFVITEEEAVQLDNFLAHEYVSHEFYPAVIQMIRRLRLYMDSE